MKKVGVLCFITWSIYPVFEYDRAIAHAQQGNWKETVTILSSLVTDRPADSQLLYDTGVAAYCNQAYPQAIAYFTDVIHTTDNKNRLHEQALFNRGNSHVKSSMLHRALKDYEAVLAFNPSNEHARANRDLVKQMLEQQEQEKNQEQQNQEQQDKNQNSSDSDQSEEAEQQEQQEQQEQKEESKDSEQSDQEQESESEFQENEHDSQWNKDEQEQQEQEQQEQQRQEEQQEQEVGGNNGPQDDSYEGIDPWLVEVLQERDKKDSDLNKQMIKATVGNQVSGTNEGNCW